MCGVCGLFTRETEEIRDRRVQAMVASLKLRGPNADGIWSSTNFPITMGHTRLAILDISAAGAQPMQSACGRWVLSYNGEIYNFRLIRQQLEDCGTTFRGTSDTEVLIEAISCWGVKTTLEKCNGMFAFAVWDKLEQRLFLVRDRMGIKPLYYGQLNGEFFFASELKAIRRAGINPAIDRAAVAEFLRYSYIPAPLSIYESIHKLPPGHILTLTAEMLDSGEVPAPEPYWKLENCIVDRRWRNAGDYLAIVEQALSDAVARRLVADVPLGAFLSGGIDSSLVVALMQQHVQSPVKTFTIGFEEPGYNEAEEARRVASFLGTDHTELYLTATDAQAVIPELADVYDEPFSDSSQIPTLLVSTLAAKHVTVCLSGDGGDELFCGYNRYVWGSRVWSVLRFVPPALRRLASRLLQLVPPAYWDLVLRLAGPVLPGSMQLKLPAEKIAKLCQVLDADSFQSLYMRLVTHWGQEESLVLGASQQDASEWQRPNAVVERLGFAEQMMYLDSMSYLPDDLLTKVDRASMARSLEVRVPFLDHTLVELAWQLPAELRTMQRDGRGKVMLRQMLGSMLPESLFERPKMGFSVPIGDWLRGPLRDWAEQLLDEKRLESQSLLAVKPVREKWSQHLSLRANNQYYLWDVLMLQSWLDKEVVNA